MYGVPSKNGAPGEKEVVAAIVVDRARFDPNAVFAACQAKLEANFVPSFLQVLDEIPKTASEKPQDRFLIEALRRPESEIYELSGRAAVRAAPGAFAEASSSPADGVKTAQPAEAAHA